MGDLISRAWVLAEYDRQHQGPPGGARKIIAEAPTVDAVPVVHGRWVTRRAGLESYPHWDSKCSACGYKVAMVLESWLYCPHCGARMDGGEDDGADA